MNKLLLLSVLLCLVFIQATIAKPRRQFKFLLDNGKEIKEDEIKSYNEDNGAKEFKKLFLNSYDNIKHHKFGFTGFKKPKNITLPIFGKNKIIKRDNTVGEYFGDQINPVFKKIYNAFKGLAENNDVEGYTELTFKSGELPYNDIECYTGTAFNAFIRDYPEYYWAEIVGYSIDIAYEGKKYVKQLSVCMRGPDSLSTVKKNMKKLRKVRETVLAEVEEEGKNEFNRIVHIYRHIGINTKFSNTGSTNEQNSYGTLYEGKAVCAGYAKAFKCLSDYLDVKALIITGTDSYNKSYTHAWNYVSYNKKWYNIDVSTDDEDGKINYDFFLLGNNSPIYGSTFAKQFKVDTTIKGQCRIFEFPTIQSKSYNGK